MMKILKKLKWKSNLLLLTFALLLSLISHAQIIYRYFTEGVLYAGRGDMLAQLVPFQMYIYDKFTHFNFFYDIGFGIGGDFFRELSYYYTTSPLYYLNFTVVYLLDIFSSIDTSNILTWAKFQLLFSIIKLTLIFYVTYKFLIYMKLNKFACFIGAFCYGFSTSYVYLTLSWNFFTDVMLWLPLSIWGFEKLVREKKAGLFILAIALTLHANFYFSYYEFVFVLFYFLYRLIYVYEEDILSRMQKLLILVSAALLGLLVASVGIFTGLSSFFLNDRSIPNIKIKPFITMDSGYNLFYNGFHVIILFLTVMALFTFKHYTNYFHRLYAVITIIFIVGSLSPLFDSFFNGFSIDQRRWIYLLSFSSAVLSAIYINNIKSLKIKDILISTIPLIIIYPVSIYSQNVFQYWIVFIPGIILFMLLYTKHKFKQTYFIIAIMTILMNFVFVNEYNIHKMEVWQNFDERNIDFINSTRYNSPVNVQMMKELSNNGKDHTRIDWNIPTNSQFINNFNGTYLYSSIFNKDIYKFYEQDLFINLPSNSNSIYSGFGGRSNLNHLFSVNKYILTMPTDPMYGYKEKLIYPEQDGTTKYHVYENNNKYPFVKVTNNIYKNSDLKNTLEKEHAMLNGVVFENEGNKKVKPVKNMLNEAEIKLNNSTLNGDTLIVNADNGGITLKLNKNLINKFKDLYLDYDIELLTPSKPHFIRLNESYQSRKMLEDGYSRSNKRMAQLVKSSKDLNLILGAGTYKIKFYGLYGEDYQQLDQSLKENKNQLNHEFVQKGDKIIIKLDKHTGGYMILPFQYLKGMKAKVDGKTAEIKEGNYLMTAVKVDRSAKEVTIKYTPPYFHILQLLSILGMILSYIFAKFLFERKIFKQDYDNSKIKERRIKDKKVVIEEEPYDDENLDRLL